MNNAAQCASEKTLVLRSYEEGENLCYVVEFEMPSSLKIFYKGENHNQAMFVAEKIYDWLRDNTDEKFTMLIEAPNSKGISYLDSSDAFPAYEINEEFYEDLCDEFSTAKLHHIHDLNALFRSIVNRFKLNQYQEHKFLKCLKKGGYV